MNINKSSTYLNSITDISNSLPKNDCTVMITGACGLIGSCLVDSLLDAGYRVIAIDLKKERLVSRFGNANEKLVFIEHNICEELDYNIKTDYIIHTASFTDPKSYALYPVETILTNVIGTKNVLNYCKHNQNTRVLITSTFEVYGKLEQDEYSEDEYGLIDYNQIRSCYPESKRTSEILLKSFIDEYNIDGVIVRLASIYGPTMLSNDSKAHAQFLFKAINNENIVLKSRGEQKRTYCYVMDAVSGILKVLFFGKKGSVYNVANSDSIATISDVAHTIAKIANVSVVYDIPDEIEKKGFSKPQNCVLNVNKIESLGWKGKYSLENGMNETLKILKECK